MTPFSPLVRPLLLLVLFSCGATSLAADTPAQTWVSPQTWVKGMPPLSFRYDGKDAAELLPRWQRQESTANSPGGQTRGITFFDPTTKLRVTAEVRSFTAFPAVEWVIRFRNEGKEESPVLEDIQPLALRLDAGKEPCTLHHARGSDHRIDDFEPLTTALPKPASVRLASRGGRSSDGSLPFFNVQIGDRGIIGAVGWTGNWAATFNRADQGQLHIRAGMQKTRLRLKAGEEIRTPRILLLNWQGERNAAHNQWRRLLLAHYVPQVKGQPVQSPVSYAAWGLVKIDRQIARVRALRAKQVPVDVFWVDAGWYGDEPFKEGANVYNTQWYAHVGNWWPNKVCYPNGLKPLGQATRDANMGLLLWVEPERARLGTRWLKEHPEWFLQVKKNESALLNLGHPGALKAVTELLSKLVDEAGLTWYRQDFNFAPEPFWTAADAPDRVGMTEIRHIEGLYAFWDALRSRHPGLQIDNCASGGRRIDLETIARSVPLWRSDYPCTDFDPIGSQGHTQGLTPWVPLSAGSCNRSTTYVLRSAYTTGLVIDPGLNVPVSQPITDEFLKPGLEEYHRVRSFFTGDYYPLLPYNRAEDGWTAYQFHRPDQNAGMALFFRRQKCPTETFEATLHALDPQAEYDVEIRPEPDQIRSLRLTGEQLRKQRVAITTKPGSLLVTYRRVAKEKTP